MSCKRADVAHPVNFCTKVLRMPAGSSPASPPEVVLWWIANTATGKVWEVEGDADGAVAVDGIFFPGHTYSIRLGTFEPFAFGGSETKRVYFRAVKVYAQDGRVKCQEEAELTPIPDTYVEP